MSHEVILIVDDEENIIELGRLYLENEGYQVEAAYDGLEALQKFEALNPALIVLDLMLPNLNGWEVCKKIRATSQVPIIMLTARTDDIDKIVGLELGADDYMTKPYNPRELVARVKAVLRRGNLKETKQKDTLVLQAGPLTIDTARREAKLGNTMLQLRTKEFDLLQSFVENKGLALTREKLLELAWGFDFYGETRTVDVHVAHLRERLKPDERVRNRDGMGSRLQNGGARMSLWWRLIISYIVIIVVTLALALVTLIIISRPIQNRLNRTRLAPQARQVGQQVDNLYRQGVSSDRVIQQLNRRLADSDSRVIFVNTEGRVLVDSLNQWAGQQLDIANRDSEFGAFRAPNGQTFNYAAIPVGPPNQPTGFVAAIATRPPFIPAFVTELGGGFVFAGIVALLLSLLLGVLIARSIALPLQQIANAAGAVAGGDYEHRVPEKGPPETKRVAASFNIMTGQVQANQQAMRDLVSNVSHELKTPLTSIQGFSQAIMEGATPDEAARQRAAGIIHQEANRMSRLVEDLLDLARIDSGQIVMQKTQLDLPQILDSTVNRLAPSSRAEKDKAG